MMEVQKKKKIPYAALHTVLHTLPQRLASKPTPKP